MQHVLWLTLAWTFACCLSSAGRRAEPLQAVASRAACARRNDLHSSAVSGLALCGPMGRSPDCRWPLGCEPARDTWRLQPLDRLQLAEAVLSPANMTQCCSLCACTAALTAVSRSSVFSGVEWAGVGGLQSPEDGGQLSVEGGWLSTPARLAQYSSLLSQPQHSTQGQPHDREFLPSSHATCMVPNKGFQER